MEEDFIRTDLFEKYFNDYHLPEYKSIPDVGLLLEQTARLVNSYLEPFTGIRLTNSMISNYVKTGIIPRPVHKLYYREQIASLIFIALAKTVLSLDDVTKYLNLQRESYPVDAAFNYFCREFEKVLKLELSSGTEPDSETTPHSKASEKDAYLVRILAIAVANCINLQLRIENAGI